MKYLLYVVASVFATVGVVFLKKLDLQLFVTEGAQAGIYAVLVNKFFWMGMVFYGLAFLGFLFIINTYKISSSVPALLGVYIITMGVAGYFLGEQVTGQKIVAYFLLIAGISLL